MGFQDWKAEAQAPKSGGSVDWSKVFGQTSAPAGATPGAAPGASPHVEPTLVIPETDHPGGDFASRAISNLPGSAGRFAEGLITAATHPVNTLTTLGGVMSGELAKGAQQLGYHGLDDPAAERMAGALNENLAKNYGSWEGFKEYAATDPVAALSDLSMLAGGAGAAAKAVGLPRVAGAASKLSGVIDPVGMAAKVAAAPLTAAGAAGRTAMGHFSGVPGETLKEIEGIARGSDAAAKEAFKTARAGGDPHAAVDAAKEALKQLGAAASDEYTATRSNLTTKQLDTQPVLDKIAEAETALGSNAAINYPDELAILGEMRNRVSSMKNTSAAELNHLKIGLNDLINDSARPNKKGMFSPVTEAVKGVISAEDPTYSRMLEGWQRWRGDLRNIEDLLGKGDRRSAMSQLGAMMKAMKTGNKGAALTLLENAPSGKYIRPMLAGTAVSPMRSSGQTLMQDMIESGAIFALTGGHPASVLPFMMSSPRGAGHVAYALGKAKGVGDKAAQYAGTPAIRGAMARIGQTPYAEEDRAERKAGGRVGVDHEAAADQLVRAAERAKGDLGKTTEGMLSMPDETIVKALDVAKRILARAIVNRPALLLLDEPLGALDLKLRRQMQIELKWIQKEVGLTFVHVTHDQEEAMTMADTIAVMNEGEIEQLGSPADLYDNPKTAFVANFLGQSNLIKGTITGNDGDNHIVDLFGQKISLAKNRSHAVDNSILAGIRPEKFRISRVATPTSGNILSGGKVEDVSYIGVSTQYQVMMPWGQELMVFEQNDDGVAPFNVGEDVNISWESGFTFALRGDEDAEAGMEVEPEETLDDDE